MARVDSAASLLGLQAPHRGVALVYRQSGRKAGGTARFAGSCKGSTPIGGMRKSANG